LLMSEIREVPNFRADLTPQEKAKYLKEAKRRATDEKPLWVNLGHAELLPWTGMGGLIPQKGIFVGVNYSRSRSQKIPQSIVLDFTRVVPIIDTPYASLPLSAVEIDATKEEIWVDCAKAVEAGVGVPLNRFIERSQN